MSTVELEITSLQADAFAPYGIVIDSSGATPKADEPSFTFWNDLAVTEPNGNTTFGILETRPAGNELTKLERHLRTTETIAPLSGSCVVVVAPPSSGATPDPRKVRAFAVQPGQAVQLHTGTWHFVPMVWEKPVRCLIVFRQGTPDEDLELCELADTVGMTFVVT